MVQSIRDIGTHVTAQNISLNWSRFSPAARSARQRLVPARILLSDELGLPADAKEAIAFAVLAYETIHGRPGNLPACTGAHHPAILGKITPALAAGSKQPD